MMSDAVSISSNDALLINTRTQKGSPDISKSEKEREAVAETAVNPEGKHVKQKKGYLLGQIGRQHFQNSPFLRVVSMECLPR